MMFRPMQLRTGSVPFALGVAAALSVGLSGAGRDEAAHAAPRAVSQTHPVRVEVSDTREFASAVERLKSTGGTIVLRRGYYRELTVGRRGSRRLSIIARAGARAGTVSLDGTRSVIVANLSIRPRGRPAVVSIAASRNITLSHLSLTAAGTRSSAMLDVVESSGVRVSYSDFSMCGDGRPPRAGVCVRLRQTRRVLIAASRFHDCYGCDFIHGSENTRLTVTRSSFDRALVGRCGRNVRRCNHQDLIQLTDGAKLVIEHSEFGVYELGEAQIFLSGPIQGVTIRDNLFRDSDPLVPGLRQRRAISLGLRRWSIVPPRYVKIVHNTILSGSLGPHGGLTSVFVSPAYHNVSRLKRPTLRHNLIALNETPLTFCPRLRSSVGNVFGSGGRCSRSDRVGDVGVVPAPTGAP
jgi:hypothetical protein